MGIGDNGGLSLPAAVPAIPLSDARTDAAASDVFSLSAAMLTIQARCSSSASASTRRSLASSFASRVPTLATRASFALPDAGAAECLSAARSAYGQPGRHG